MGLQVWVNSLEIELENKMGAHLLDWLGCGLLEVPSETKETFQQTEKPWLISSNFLSLDSWRMKEAFRFFFMYSNGNHLGTSFHSSVSTACAEHASSFARLSLCGKKKNLVLWFHFQLIGVKYCFIRFITKLLFEKWSMPMLNVVRTLVLPFSKRSMSSLKGILVHTQEKKDEPG